MMATEMPKLKPCPGCGRTNEVNMWEQVDDEGIGFSPYTGTYACSCGWEGPAIHSKLATVGMSNEKRVELREQRRDKARELWNKRAS